MSARPKGTRSSAQQRLASLPAARQEARIRAAEAISRMRHDELTLSAAAREAHTTPATVRRYFPKTLERTGGRWRATRADREPFLMLVTSTEGPVERWVAGSAKRSLVGAHQAAIQRFLDPFKGGDESTLRSFVGKRVAGVTLETDPKRLEELAYAGELSFLEIYLAL